jgi:putative Mn2+ efflux pump MntP
VGAVLLLGVLLGLDSFRAALALGVAGVGFRRCLRTALAFGVCDGVAPVLGLVLGSAAVESAAERAGWLGPLVLGPFGLFTFVAAGREHSDDLQTEPAAGTAPRRGLWVSIGLPLVLSIDNLVAGFGLGASRVPIALTATVLGLASAAMALAGLHLGSWIHHAWPERAERLGGAALVMLALAMAFDLV